VCFLLFQVAKWTIGNLSSEKFPQLTGSLLLQPYNTAVSFNSATQQSSSSSANTSTSSLGVSTYNESNVAPVIEIEWKVPMSNFSGLAVSSLQLTGERYKPYKGVRSVAQSGKFLIRSI
jgi:hypothetical protein